MTSTDQTQVAAGAAGFEIYLAWSERTLWVGPEETALAVLMAAGVQIEPGCTLGGCGACVTRYVEGDVVHKNSILSLEDRKSYFSPCVSRAKTRIVLAL